MKEILRNKCGFPICFGQVQIDEKSNRNPFDMVQKIESIISFNFNHSIFVFDSMHHSKIISSFFLPFRISLRQGILQIITICFLTYGIFV